jgi:hypothetical protein
LRLPRCWPVTRAPSRAALSVLCSALVLVLAAVLASPRRRPQPPRPTLDDMVAGTGGRVRRGETKSGARTEASLRRTARSNIEPPCTWRVPLARDARGLAVDKEHDADTGYSGYIYTNKGSAGMNGHTGGNHYGGGGGGTSHENFYNAVHVESAACEGRERAGGGQRARCRYGLLWECCRSTQTKGQPG